MTGDALEGLEETLAAYRRAKWAELNDAGQEALVRELAGLDRFLDQAEGLDWASDRLVAFRREKARILREVLEEAG